jgi:hypothetical protein
MEYWPALQIVNQVAGEVGLAKVQTLFAPDDQNAVQSNQLLSALNSAGNELGFYYPWEQFKKEWVFTLVEGQSSYDLPPGWSYFIDQTQWDRTNHWPLLGPKSAAEWAWLKGGLLASFPRMRYRVMNNKFEVFPTPASNSEYVLSMEYVTENWVQSASSTDQEPNAALVMADGDLVWYQPWLMVKYTKLKWMQLKNFPSEAAASDFQRMYAALQGKDAGAQVLSLVPRQTPVFIGPWSIPDGNWSI